MGFEIEAHFLYITLALTAAILLAASAFVYFKLIGHLREKARMGF